MNMLFQYAEEKIYISMYNVELLCTQQIISPGKIKEKKLITSTIVVY